MTGGLLCVVIGKERDLQRHLIVWRLHKTIIMQIPYPRIFTCLDNKMEGCLCSQKLDQYHLNIHHNNKFMDKSIHLYKASIQRILRLIYQFAFCIVPYELGNLCRSPGIATSVNRISWHRSMDISPLQFMSTVGLSLQHHSSFHCMHAVFLLLIKISMKCEGRYLTLAWYCFKRFECVSVSFLFPYIRSCPSQNRPRLHPGNAIRFGLQIVRATHCSF